MCRWHCRKNIEWNTRCLCIEVIVAINNCYLTETKGATYAYLKPNEPHEAMHSLFVRVLLLYEYAERVRFAPSL